MVRKLIRNRQVEYSLTLLRETLIEPWSLLAEWSEQHIDQMLQSRSSQ